MQNDDDQCFKQAVSMSLNPVSKNAERITREFRKQSEKLNWDGIEFPTPCSEKMFRKFEQNNNVSILVFGHDGKGKDLLIIPLYFPKIRYEKIVRLFFLRSEDGKSSHYFVINSMSRLVGGQLSKNKT